MSSAEVGEPAPWFTLTCIGALDETPRPVKLSDYSGYWLVLIFYPRDFSFVCPTELTAFGARLEDFRQRDCRVLGVSVDSIQLHREWFATPTGEGGVGPLPFPLASDAEGSTARDYGVWVQEKLVSARGLFVIDPEGVLQYSVVHNLNVGRSPDEVLRVLDALQTGALCPASWTSAAGTIDPERALQPGRILGHYRIRTRLGKGSFGAVFAAWDLRLERMVAVKVLKQHLFESRDAVLAEARAAARLSHPNICAVYAIEEEAGLPLIVMEFLDGRPLSQAIQEGMDSESALKLGVQVASAMAAAHQQGVVHGDLNPSNIIVTIDGAAKILDFGLAAPQRAFSATDADTSAQLPRDATQDILRTDAALGVADEGVRSAPRESRFLRGTPAYMSPEQAAGAPLAPAGDVFSFGLTLFEMLTGRRAISEETPMECILRLRTRDVAAEVRLMIDEDYRELITATLARDAAERPPMAEVARRLAARPARDAPIA
jgi:alkyl hydroperoxide reductase subunit AhpC/tRNA A-37 threonylcarbamoyl transferase component Bud32